MCFVDTQKGLYKPIINRCDQGSQQSSNTACPAVKGQGLAAAAQLLLGGAGKALGMHMHTVT